MDQYTRIKTPTETWLAVVGYEGAYEVSDQGRVRSLSRMVNSGQGRTRQHVGRVLSIFTGDHYSKVRLKLDGDGGKTHNVHTLVIEAFFGPRPDGLEVLHGMGGPHDNRVSNLRYDTHAANQREMVTVGHHYWARRTECLKGHPYSAENTLLYGKTKRRNCKICVRARSKRLSAERKVA